jgi:hypothetical protein
VSGDSEVSEGRGGDLLQGGVAKDGRYAEQFDARVVGGKEDGKCILDISVRFRAFVHVSGRERSYIVAGVAVEPNGNSGCCGRHCGQQKKKSNDGRVRDVC